MRKAQGSQELLAPLDIAEQYGIVERQFELIAIENLEDHDFVPAIFEPRQSVVKRIEIGEQIGDDDNQAPFLDFLAQGLQHGAQVGFAIGPGRFERR